MRPISVWKSDAEIIERLHRVNASGVMRIAPVVEGPMDTVGHDMRLWWRYDQADFMG